MRAVVAVFLLVAMSTVTAQDAVEEPESVPVPDASNTATSPALAVLVHHPFPDASDPLGVEYVGSGADAYWHRYQHLDTDDVPGFDFPHTVFDGIVAIEGIPEGDGPFIATRSAYEAAYTSRAGVESPLNLSVYHTRGWDDAMARDVVVYGSTTTDLSSEDLTVWAAIVEDPVHYEPPPALSNGVFVHPFVVRAIGPVGPVEGLLDGGGEYARFHPVNGDGPEAWNMDRIRAVAWVQQGASDGLRFDAHEVVQAVMETPESNSAVASEKVVLMEMYSATWCDTCLFGDRVAEELAVEHGVQRDLESESTGYLRDGPWVLALAGGLVAAVLVAWPRLDGGRP